MLKSYAAKVPSSMVLDSSANTSALGGDTVSALYSSAVSRRFVYICVLSLLLESVSSLTHPETTIPVIVPQVAKDLRRDVCILFHVYRMSKVYRLNRRNTTAFRPWIRAVNLGENPRLIPP
jgi:hypothetical protein